MLLLLQYSSSGVSGGGGKMNGQRQKGIFRETKPTRYCILVRRGTEDTASTSTKTTTITWRVYSKREAKATS